MKPIATDIYTFSNLVGGGYLYVDKTGILADLITGYRGKQFFFSRPRRFGKSLTVTTLKSIFEGRRELFKGLAIDRRDYDWKPYPVIRLDMSMTFAETVEEFRLKSNEQIRVNRDRLGLSFELDASADVSFSRLVAAAAASSESKQVVLLVDEYDKPLLGHLGRPTVEAFRTALKSFYSVIKATEALQRFTFITGVSKFSKVSIFSDLNNLVDLTMDARAATLAGYTHEEVKANFAEHLAALGEANGLTPEAAFDRVVRMYDGYRFHHAGAPVFNPVSLGRCFADGEFRSYWYETGTPTFLVNMLKARPVDISRVEVSEVDLGTYEPSNPSLLPLLYQTGYLTIKGFRALGNKRLYTLGFPNEEVCDAFNSSLMPVYTDIDGIELGSVQTRCAEALLAHDVDGFVESMKDFFANVPYTLTDRGGEQVFQAILYTALRFVGVCVRAEVVTNRGRIDAVVHCPNDVYVIEVKLDRSAQEAIDQIKARGYAEKYRASGARVTLLGINFSSKVRQIDDVRVEAAGIGRVVAA